MYNRLKERLIYEGAYNVGTSYQEDTPFPGLNYAISIEFRLSEAIIDTITDNGPTQTYFHHYRTANARLDAMALLAVTELQKAGFNAANVPASQSIEGYRGLFSHKKGAVDAGLGYIGKSALYISHKYGPSVRLATVFTDMELPVEKHEYICGCGDCTICADMCPAEAIGRKNWSENIARTDFFDAEKCSKYMKDKFQKIGRGAVCGICMRFCPKRNK